ncbi:MAG: hypothetical protein GF393_13020 [Armatimonadia bacterium]|nr:hypothetical protein [Armatimonadia bacterium]
MTTNDKNERFIKLAEKRVNSAIKTIRLIGNLANRKTYQYSDHEAKQILDALTKELKDLKQRFSSDGVSGSQEFRFKRARQGARRT